MNKPVTSVYYLFILLFTFDSFGQAIDPALLENLSPEQIELAKSELAKSDFEDETKPKTISESTIKTHVSNLLVKLNARRRTQAIQRAKAERIL